MLNFDGLATLLESRYEQLLAHSAAPAAGLMLPSLSRLDKDTAEFIFEPDHRLTNTHGTLHGGFLALAFDSAMTVYARAILDGKPCVTTELSIRYHKPMPLDSQLVLKVRAISSGKTLISLFSEAYMQHIPERITASATATFYHSGS